MSGIADEVKALVAHATAAAEAGYTVETQRDDERTRSGWTVIARPADARLPLIRAHGAADVPEINLTLGEAAVFELGLSDPTRLEEAVAAELAALAAAAARGALIEELWYLGDDLVRSRATVVLNGEKVSTTWASVKAWWPRGERRKEVRKYLMR